VWSAFKNWRRRRLLRRLQLPEILWNSAFSRLPLLHRLEPEEQQRLRDLALLFLHEKVLEIPQQLELDDTMQLMLALQACLPILNLGLDWYEGWVSVIIYPDQFISNQPYTDAAGVVHRQRRVLSGEAWLRGPVVLAWEDVEGSGECDGDNVVLHEFAHKLDMLNGDANGHPPLHKGMKIEDWSRAFGAAYEDFRRHAQWQDAINPYAAESPAEFFAVLSEVFFEIPEVLIDLYPAVYAQMRAFYKQDPAAGFARAGLTLQVGS